MYRLFLLGVSTLLLFSITGCTIFSFKIRASKFEEAVEISRIQALSIRKTIPTSYLAKAQKSVRFALEEIEKSASALILSSIDKQQQNNAMQWKTLAKQSFQQILSQSNPQLILLDTWIYIKQMDQYFSSGSGRAAFGRNQYIAIGTTRSLQARINRAARESLSTSEYNKMKSFIVNGYFPFTTSLVYKTVHSRWQRYQNLNKTIYINDLDKSKLPAEHYKSNSAANFVNNEMQKHKVNNLNQEIDELGDQDNLFNAKNDLSAQWDQISNNTNEYSENLAKEMLEKAIKLASNLRSNLALLAVEVIGTLTPMGTDIEWEKSKNQNIGEKTVNLSALPEKSNITTDKSLSTGEKANNLKDVKSFEEKINHKLWNGLSTFFPNVVMYIFLIMMMIFVIPFLLGYFIGKKRQDPNFTVISSVESRKALR